MMNDIRELILCLRDHGRTLGDKLLQNTTVAFKYKMSAMQAAVGILPHKWSELMNL